MITAKNLALLLDASLSDYQFQILREYLELGDLQSFYSELAKIGVQRRPDAYNMNATEDPLLEQIPYLTLNEII